MSAVQGTAVGVDEAKRVDGVLRQIGAEAAQRDDGSLQVVVSIYAHRVGVHLPAVDDAGQGQPELPDTMWNFAGYLCTAWHHVHVLVE